MLYGLRRNRVPCLEFDDVMGLFQGQPKVLPPDHFHQVIGLHVNQNRRRFTPADQDHMDAFGNIGKSVTNHFMERRFDRHFLVVIKNKERWCVETMKKVFKITQRKGRQAGQVFRSEIREWFSLSRCGFFCRKSQVIEKGCRVSVALICLVPQANRLFRFQVAGNQRGLATAGRS